MHKLKKYPNRRLYDMTDSKYVTVEDVRRLIIKGESISVIDSKDESDLTRTVLLQILAEQEQSGTGTVLTNRTIEQLIRFYDDRFGRVASRYIEEAISAFLEHQHMYRDRMRQLNALNPLNLMKQAFEGFTPPSPERREPTEANRDDTSTPNASEPDSGPTQTKS
ncbi:MAG: polyhydroxyalkanoate synthesis repressor PhaR [Pseudomonadota bacterium]